MTADAAFWGTQAALGLAIGLATAAAFLIGVMLFGTASRRRQQKIIKLTSRVRTNRVAIVRHEQPAIRSLAREHIEVVCPEIN